MNKRKIMKKAAYVAALLVLIGLESCISLYTGRATLIDTGGAIANVGQERPHLHPERQTVGKSDYGFHYRVLKKGEKYIVEIPVCYTPANYSVLVHFAGHNTWNRKTLNGEFPARFNNKELARYPQELFYAELTEDQYRQLWKIRRHMKEQRPSPFRDVPIRPAAEVDLSGTEQVLDIYGERYHRIARIWNNSSELPPPRRTWYNYCLMPLSWVGEVADIPLSLIATPVGWLVDAVYEPIAN